MSVLRRGALAVLAVVALVAAGVATGVIDRPALGQVRAHGESLRAAAVAVWERVAHLRDDLTARLPGPAPSGAGEVPVPTGPAADALAGLEIAGRAPMTGYERDAFEYRAYDQDRNGCDVRNDVLRRDLEDVAVRPGTQGCVVETGLLVDPFSGETIAFERGPGTSEAVQVDHVVALADAWQKGAQGWDAQARREFGNDPLNLLAVDGALNQVKGAGDAATWLPPDAAARCPYVARQIAVKATHGLWVTQAEHDAMARVLGTCPGQPLPERETAPLLP